MVLSCGPLRLAFLVALDVLYGLSLVCGFSLQVVWLGGVWLLVWFGVAAV